MARKGPPDRPDATAAGRWSQASTLVLLVGALAALAAILAVALLAASDFRSTIAANESHAALLARVLEDQATRTLESGEMALEALSTSPALRAVNADTERTQAALNQALLGLPYLRSIAVLDAYGNVLTSTNPREAGLRVDLERLGPVGPPGRGSMGSLVMGRGLAAVRAGGKAAEPAPPGVAFIPLLHAFVGDSGRPLVLVGLANPDAFSNFQYLTLETDSFESVITTYRGTVLAGSEGGAKLVGTSVGSIPVFTSFLPAREHGIYVGQGALGSQQILAFRTSGTKPLVVIVEQSYRQAAWSWFYSAAALVGVGGVLVLAILGLTAAIWRTVRLREAARLAADQAQQRIAQSERELSVLMRSVQELIFRTDVRGVITYVNAHWMAFSGTPAEQAIGRRLQDIVDPVSRAEVTAALDPRAPAGVRHCQAMVRLADGRELQFDVALVALQVDGQFAGFAGSAVNVTERWAAQRRLQAQIAFQNLLLDMNPLPISVTNTEGAVVQVNRAWEEYKGLERAMVVGRRLTGFLPADEAQVEQLHNDQLVRMGGQTFFETKVLHGDGARRETRVIKAAIADAQSKASGVLTIFVDVSEFRQAERATQEARHAAEEASRAKSEFVANMSHELRTPLQSILGFAELGMLRGRAEPRLAGMFEDIHSAGQRMLSLVNDLLEVAKLESTVGTIHLERIDLRGLIQPVVQELEPLLTRNQQSMRVELSDMPLVAKVDPLRMQQVLRNVLANAIKFSPKGSAIHLQGRMDSHGQVHVEVRDEGPGIPEAELESIFEAFVQSSKTKDGSGGTGLGLAICRKIVEAMGGRIFARNREPRGASFHIVLPARGFTETQPAPL
ncbi:PAS domain S-box protein [Acidovorax sp. DW039]|uniref:sensor histidine kinase n=1 Tax=Acidovorax sp. DW039 TaxID=3095606 RepID=UPI00308E2C28|nr:PAS domain S-box protein [Acidovorax sp. DW039]